MISTVTVLDKGGVLQSGEREYRIEETLGKGGFGITYLAMGEIMVGSIPTEGKFAIKEHFPEQLCVRMPDGKVKIKEGMSDLFNKSRADFMAEAKRLQELGAQNNNIVKVNEVFEANGTAYYVMQYINGQSLKAYVKQHGPLHFSKALQFLMPIIDAIGFLHNSRINHLDIKPDNIMLHKGKDGLVPILIDFGLSVHFKKEGGKTTPRGLNGLSEGYAPLEQYADIDEFSPATDIYSLMATLLYAVTGNKPESAIKIHESDIIEALRNKVPDGMIPGIIKAMKKEPKQRTKSIGELKSNLGLGDSLEDASETETMGETKKKAETKTPDDSSENTEVRIGQGPAPAAEDTSETIFPIITETTPTSITETTSDTKVDPQKPARKANWLLWGGLGGAAIALAIVLPLALGGGKDKDAGAGNNQTRVETVVINEKTEVAEQSTASGLSEDESNQSGKDEASQPIQEGKEDAVKPEPSQDKSAPGEPERRHEDIKSKEQPEAKKSLPEKQPETVIKEPTTGTLSLGYGTWYGGIKNGKADGKGKVTFTSTHSIGGVTTEPGYTMQGTYENGKLVYGKIYDSSGQLVKTVIP